MSLGSGANFDKSNSERSVNEVYANTKDPVVPGEPVRASGDGRSAPLGEWTYVNIRTTSPTDCAMLQSSMDRLKSQGVRRMVQVCEAPQRRPAPDSVSLSLITIRCGAQLSGSLRLVPSDTPTQTDVFALRE